MPPSFPGSGAHPDEADRLDDIHGAPHPADCPDHWPGAVHVANRGRKVPVDFMFMGSATSSQAPIAVVQYKVEGGQFVNAVNVSGNWSQFSIPLPLPPTAGGPDHVLTVRAIDTFGTVGEISKSFAVHPEPPIVVPPGSDTTFTGAPTTSSITSWTRLEPQCSNADIGTSSMARIFDPLWMLTRQWQMGEFQAEDAGTPIQARVRATTATVCRRFSGELPKSATPAPALVAAQPYDPLKTPLEVLVERRRMRANDETDGRMLTFAVEAGLHFLRTLELARSVEELPVSLHHQARAPAAVDRQLPAHRRRLCALHAVDGRAGARRTAACRAAADDRSRAAGRRHGLNIAVADRPKVQQAATTGSPGTTRCTASLAARPTTRGTRRGWIRAIAVGAKLSANPGDEITLSASEIDGPIDWSSFDVTSQALLTTARIRASRRSSRRRSPRP